jgi:hypothetical protein
MKKILLIVAFAWMAVQGVAQGQSQSPPPQVPDEYVTQIEQHTKEMANNTKPILVWNGKTLDSWVIMVVSLCSLSVGIVSAYNSLRTARNAKQTALNVQEQTRQQEINRPAQDAILRDLIHHLYNNKVTACAIRWKLTDLGFDKCYPSEEYLLKMKVLPEDLSLDRFDSSPDHYGKLHKMRLLFRHYTIEIDVALGHIKTRTLPQSVKIEDLLALEYKSQLLTEKIRNLMDCTGLTLTDDNIRDMLLEKHDEHDIGDNTAYDPKNIFERSDDKYQYYDKIGLTAQLNKDIYIKYRAIDTIDFPVQTV